MAISVDNKFVFLHMPKTAGITAYNMLHEICGDRNTPLTYHTLLKDVRGADGLPIVIGSRDVDSWHLSYYNYVFKQMKKYPYHIHELFKETPTFEEFLAFSYHKECDYGKDMNNPNNAYAGFDYITTLHNDWWSFDGNLYDYMRSHLLCGKEPDFVVRQEHYKEDWDKVLSHFDLTMVQDIKKYNKGAY